MTAIFLFNIPSDMNIACICTRGTPLGRYCDSGFKLREMLHTSYFVIKLSVRFQIYSGNRMKCKYTDYTSLLDGLVAMNTS